MIKNKAFTIIELLVVIAIIGVLASIVLVNVNNIRVKARDARRLADINQLAKVLKFYVADNGSFPSNAGCVSGWCCLGHGDSGTCWAGQYHGSTALDNSLSPIYVSKLPDDPLNNTSRYGDAYMYTTGTDTNGIYAILHWGIEKANPTSQDCLGGTIGKWGAGTGIGNDYYCILQIRQ